MKKQVKKYINSKSEAGFTMQDITIAMMILMIFIGIIGGMFVTLYKLNTQIKVTANATYYAMQILENIDKIAYEDVTESLESKYAEEIQGYQINLEIEPYNDQYHTMDLIKKVKLTISHESFGETGSFVVQRLKIKEV